MFRRTRSATNAVRRGISAFIVSDHFAALAILIGVVMFVTLLIWLTIITEGFALVGLIILLIVGLVYSFILAGIRGEL